MPEKNYIIIINDYTRIVVYFKSDKNKVLNFIIKIEYFFNNKWLEVERYDCYHGVIHKDILNKYENKKRTIKYIFLDKKSGLNVAIRDFKDNHEFIIKRFINETK
jgi:hypothetical protein